MGLNDFLAVSTLPDMTAKALRLIRKYSQMFDLGRCFECNNHFQSCFAHQVQAIIKVRSLCLCLDLYQLHLKKLTKEERIRDFVYSF